MAISFGAVSANQGGQAISATTTLTGVTTGDLIVVFTCSNDSDGDTPIITSTPSETWTVDDSVTGSLPRVYLVSTVATSTDDYDITATYQSSSTYPSIFAVRVSGNWGANRFITSQTNTGTSTTSLTTSDLSATAAAFLILGHTDQFTGADETVTPNTNWTELVDLDNDSPSKPIRGSYRIVSSSGDYSVAATYSGAVNWRAISGVYQEEASGTNSQINIGDAWKQISSIRINIGDSWKTVSSMRVNIGDSWKTIF